jgi:hypothetical protein
LVSEEVVQIVPNGISYFLLHRFFHFIWMLGTKPFYHFLSSHVCPSSSSVSSHKLPSLYMTNFPTNCSLFDLSLCLRAFTF